MILGKLKNTSTVHITGKSNDWYKIKFNGGHGFVHSSSITPQQDNNHPKDNPKAVSFLATSRTGTVYNLYQGVSLHVRSGAGLTYSIIGDLHNGDTVNIINQIGNWYEINYNGQIAYVYASYINTNSTSNNNSSNSSTPTSAGTVCNLSNGVYLHVRTGPSLDNSIIAYLSEGDTVNIIKEVNGWDEIEYNGQIAYVYAAYVNSNNNNNNSTNSIPATQYTGTVCNLSNGVYLHVRTGPSLDNEIIAYLNEGDTVNIIKEVNGWYEINYNGQIAYVYSAYVNPNNNNNDNSNSTQTNPIPATKYTGTVCNLNPGVVLHVRSGAGLNYNIIADLTEGTTVNIIKEVNGWYEINYNGQIAYVYGAYINTNNNNDNSNSTQTSPVPTTKYTGTVCNLNPGVVLHVRSGAGLNYNIIADLTEGTTVNIIKEVNGWYEINYNGQVAYVYGAYVNPNNNSSNNNGNSNQTSSIPPTKYTGTVCNLSNGVYLHVRTGPSLDNKIIAYLNEGTTVNIIKEVNGWYEINYNGQIAYVYAYYVSPNNSSDNNNSNNNGNSSNNSTNSIPATKYTGTVCNLNPGIVLHVRSGAGLNYNIIADLTEGATVNIIKEVNGWYEINYNGQIAYVYGAYVSPNNSNNNNSNNNGNSNQTNSIPATKYTGTVCNLSNGVYLHVRTGPSLDNEIIAYLNEGDTVNIIKEVNGWYEINYNGQIAYVYAYYVSPNNNSSNNSSNNNSDNSSSSNNNYYHLHFGKNSTVITTKYPGTLQQYINAQYNNWPYYSESEYRNYINPATANNIYQFLTVNTFRNINVNKLNNALNGDGVLSGQGQAFYDAAKEFNLDPLYFVAQCLLETGRGTSYLASGVTITQIANTNAPIYSNGVLVGYQMIPLSNPVTVYNLFGIGAYDNTSAFPNRALILGTTYAYNHGWTSVSSAIAGAAQFISNSYIHSSFNQITPYELRYNPVLSNIWHQYATTAWYGSTMGELIKSLSYIYSEGDKFTFNVPTFNN